MVCCISKALNAVMPHSMALHLMADSTLTWQLDPDHLGRAIDNLLRNAVQHSAPEASIRIEVHVLSEVLHIDVINQGNDIPPISTAAVSGGSVALASNLVNNLLAGLIASSVAAMSHLPQRTVDALLIGLDIGPNLSITGSLATILWLMAIRREGEDVHFMTFLKIGLWVMPVALIGAMGSRILMG